MITLSNDAPDMRDKLWLLGSALVTGAMIAVTLLLATPLGRLIGTTGLGLPEVGTYGKRRFNLR